MKILHPFLWQSELPGSGSTDLVESGFENGTRGTDLNPVELGLGLLVQPLHWHGPPGRLLHSEGCALYDFLRDS